MSERPTLQNAVSPFLKHGATQPVAWLPWGEAALDFAKREDRPILLDIGAVWCHWCHVMDRESYDDPATAALINEHFIPVKVDRDERPDVDARYQRAVQALAGQGGWPLTAFLTPDGRAFYGGTYFPPTDAHGRPLFRRVLQEVARAWREDRERALRQAEELSSRIAASEAGLRRSAELGSELVALGEESLADEFDFRHGGFGRAPKFPNPGGLHLLLDRWLDDGEEWQRRVVLESLVSMGRGGIFDQLGGGFHRYATDARWLIPHFEKMASDNGALLELYARAAATFEEPLFGDVARGILRYYRAVAPHLLERGGFPASQDADTGMDDDGDYWTWTEEEVASALEGDERLTRAALLRYGFDDPAARMHLDPERHVLFLARDTAQVAAELGESDAEAVARSLGEAARRLVGAREARPRPFVDETVYADWTAMVAAGHLAAARYVEAEAATPALAALERIWSAAWREGTGIAHRVDFGGGGPGEPAAEGTAARAAAEGFLSDQAFVAAAFLDAFELSQRDEWLSRAAAIADIMLSRFRAPDGAGFVDRPSDADAPGALSEPHRPIADAPEPSGNAIAALTLLRLEALLDAPRYGDAARRTLTAFAGAASRLASGAATYFRAVDWALSPVTTVVVVGAEPAPAADPLFREALGAYRPRTVLRRFQARSVDARSLPAAVRAMLSADAPRAYVCAGRTCAAPVATPEELSELLRSFRG